MSQAEYHLAERLYEGDRVALYRAHKPGSRTTVIAKVLTEPYPDPRDIAKLRHEYAILRDLNVPGVVKVLDLHRHANSLYLILEPTPGEPLDKIIKSKKLPLITALQIAKAIAVALGGVHKKGVIHRDIKPHNILADVATGEITLLDFGISSRLRQESVAAAMPDALEGTLAYMSPEQTGRMNRAVDHRSDFYSLGVTMYEMLTGQLPFPVTQPMAMIHSHIARAPRHVRDIAPDVLTAVDDIVMKLLSKTAEDRYQTAEGLAADLDHCIEELSKRNVIEPFPLGRHDSSGELNISQRLYGREAETSVLMEAFARAAKGAVELLLVSGYSGIGKSALIHEVHKPIAHNSGTFITGKFDQLSLRTPYFAVMQAFQDLVRQALKEPQEIFAGIKESLIAAVGSNGRLLTDLVPALELVLGPQPEVAALGPTASQNRFLSLIQNFLRVFATPERPLVIFLDDLQWADPASLKLLNTLLTDRGMGHLLVIGAYRDNEVDSMHLLSIALDDARKDGATIHEIKLKPLAAADVTALIAETLGSTAARVQPLSAVVYERTLGNPFFMNQFLKAIHKEKLLVFDAAPGAWSWDIDSIRGMKATDNVVELMLGALRKLAPATQRVLMLAACIGHRFDQSTLALVDERPQNDTAADLWEALSEGLVVPLDPEYRFAYDEERSGPGDAPPASKFRIEYRFLHDRVQQAAYSLASGERQKQEIHLRIGRLIRARRGASDDSDRFEVVNHLNIGAPLITDRGERDELARLNAAAGKKAKDATAYAAAAGYFKAGIAALGEGDGWDRERDLAFAITIGLAECESLSGRFDEAEALFKVLMAHAASNAERAQIYLLCSVLYLAQDKYQENIKAVRAGLALFGVELPEAEEQCKAESDVELSRVPELLAGRSITSLINAPELDDPDIRTIEQLMMNLCIATYERNHFLGRLAMLKNVSIGLKHGHSNVTANAYAMLGLMLSAAYLRNEEGFAFGKLALALNEKFHNATIKARLNFLFAVQHFASKHLRDSLPYYSAAIQAGLESGEFVFASHACSQSVDMRLCKGDELTSIQEEIQKSLPLLQRTKHKFSLWRVSIAKQHVANLKGQTKNRGTLDDDTFSEADLLRTLDAAKIAFLVYALYLAKLELAVIYGDYKDALGYLTEAEKRAWSCRGTHNNVERFFYGSLALLAAYPAASDAEKQRYLTTLDSYLTELATWAKACPANYRHKHLLVLAERASLVEGDPRAMDIYDQAIAAAWESDFQHEEALAKELCARFYVAKGKTIIARAYMTDALYGYQRWGATAKVSLLVERYPELVSRSTTVHQRPSASKELGTVTRHTSGGAIDILAVIRAAQAVSGEMVLDKLLDRLMGIVIENAGARKGVLLLEHDGRLSTEASATVEPDVVRVIPSVPVDDGTNVPASVVNYVRRTKATVIFGSGTVDPIFANDPYLAANQPESLLCMPLINQGRLTGVLYLENKITKDAFPQARVEMLTLLASQAAVAIENSLLYTDLQKMTGELRDANERLTVELARRVQSEEERLRAEKERATLQEAIIQTQKERLSELSTPFIPITEGIMVMPLIGTIDETRAERILETALHGAQSSHAKMVIIDITGVKGVDTAIAGTLIRTASALRLLGTSVMLSGIRPEVAQTLVMLNVDLGSIVTRGNLQSAIAWALTQSSDFNVRPR